MLLCVVCCDTLPNERTTNKDQNLIYRNFINYNTHDDRRNQNKSKREEEKKNETELEKINNNEMKIKTEKKKKTLFDWKNKKNKIVIYDICVFVATFLDYNTLNVNAAHTAVTVYAVEELCM